MYIEENGNMAIVKKSFGKNYLRCYKNEKGKIYSCEQIRKSWNNKVNYVTENSSTNVKGLRQAQLGAVFAIRAHWIVSKKAATVVMPTGTGKTETMITTIVAEQCKRVFILVPSELLRVQTVENCAKFGILKDIGVIDQRAKYPNVLCLKSQPKTKDELKEMLDSANIIVSTAKLISRFDIEYMNMLSSRCDVLIVDEAHHIEANRWNQIKSFFSDKRILQFTATPFRNDGKKLDGDIIYNFPLSMAQEQGYFQKINFKPIIEYDEEKGDYAIAQAAVKQLKSDLENGFNHIILVRTKGVRRAKQLFENIYAYYFSQYNPVLIIGEMSALEKKLNMEALKIGKSQIVVCVDMFGEGIDIPNLKIAAIHDRYKSLPITLQFIGRFARSKAGLGDATIITNLANEDIQDALTELYSQDSDWNNLLSELSEEVIGKEISLQKLANGFKGSGIESINIKQLRPALSMVAYKTDAEEWHWENWIQLFDEDLCKYYINEEENIFIVIEPEESKIDWANYREISNLNWNLHIAYWNKEKEVVFLNSTNKAIFNKFAETLFTNVQRISGENIFKCLHGINRLMVANLGLNSAIGGPIRYKMFTGIDIVEAISESQKGNCYKSNIFGIGYNGDGKTSIGCSYKGTIWGRLVETIDTWKEWCNLNYEKIINPNIHTVDILKGVLMPVIIKERPKKHAYRIDWPNDLDLCNEKSIYLETPYAWIPIYEMEIGLIEVDDIENLKFYVQNEDYREEFELVINNEGWSISQIKGVYFRLHIKNKSYDLADFFKENSPEIKFVDQSSLQGNLYVTLESSTNFRFSEDQLVRWTWDKVDISKESQGLTKEKDSIQYFTIHKLLSDHSYEIVFDDDNAGEIADIIAIKEKDKEIHFEFYHCKFSHGPKAGSRVVDLYEVCGQAEKSVLWKQNMCEVIERMRYRESRRMKLNGVSRFEKGDLKKLSTIRNKLRFLPAKLDIFIVQPGVSASTITEDMHQILCGTQAYLLDTYGITLQVICSQ